ncbi:sensor histidine kinase [Clostridium sp.]|uniref:sensor histidine kinase n=1 Tax=Clostridium sp. TaxID=1506 RepID=UPI002608C75F|nr:ATP-binding protein [uncultured Clostridium sp.]
MQSIRKRLSIILVCTSILALFLATLFVNIAISKTFNKYLVEIQTKRDTGIVTYLETIYKKNAKWSKTSGIEITHEAYMSNYCLTLKDINKKVVWGMNANDIINNTNNSMPHKSSGVYTLRTLQIKYKNKIVGYVDIGQNGPVLLTSDDVNFKTSINKSIILSIVLSLLITILISLIISKQFSNPLRQVSEISVDLSNGNYNARSYDRSTILELENLRNSINSLGENLKHQDTLRKRLISDISHEIRTPLNILQNNFEAMIDGIFPIDNKRLIYLNDEVIRFGKLIDNLNTLKQIEGEETVLNVEKISLKDILTLVQKEFEIISENKNIKMALKCSVNNQFYILGDTDKIKQVIINLLSNAVKFTQEQGEINITLKESDKKVILEIQDTGIGIKKDDLPYIFERLYRGDKSRHVVEGSGIGLTIVRNILTLHNADIEVKSVEGKGSMFILYFNKIL